MKEFTLVDHKDLIPYIPLVCNKEDIPYVLDNIREPKIITDISNRNFKRIIRKAWARKISTEKHYNILTREDIGETNISGYIPENEFGFFEKAYNL